MHKLKVIIKGETINLCQPTKIFAVGDIWYKWLNNPSMNRHLEKKYRSFRNTKEKQLEFFVNAKKNKRKIFIISTKNHVYKGVISVSKIDNINKTCDIALLTDTRIEPLLAPYAGLEAMALMSNYAFSKLKLKKIDCAFKLSQKAWQQRTELLGFKHIFRSRYKPKTYSSTWSLSMSDFEIDDLRKAYYYTSLCFKDFKVLLKKRGKLWDSLNLMKKRISKLPEKSFLDISNTFFEKDKKSYYDKIYKL
ncbi:hypothetical protein N9599_00130 [Candidatus Pelagibacter sp.]|jgi:hypothetical protein|nr:hypothetical protein [Candidatus Pelagibacter sp.]